MPDDAGVLPTESLGLVSLMTVYTPPAPTMSTESLGLVSLMTVYTPPVPTMSTSSIDGNRCAAQPWFSEGIHSDAGGEITVTVEVEGVVRENALVHLFHRTTRTKVNAGRTDAAGQITFSDLNRNAAGDYYVIAFSEEDYNALVYDKLTAV